MAKTVLELSSITSEDHPQVLLLGNGINRLFQKTSWEDIITGFAKDSGICCDASALNRLPATMQIVAISGNHVDSKMAQLAEKLLQEELSEEQKTLLQGILSIPFQHIITTNYTYEIEQTLYPAYSRGRAGRSTFYTVDKLDCTNDMMLHRVTKLLYGEEDRFIWHINGLAYKPSSIVIGHYYYGKLLSQIRPYVGTMMARYNAAKAQDNHYVPKSWIDYFLMGDVHILGFGMDPSEFDLWWLVCFKQRYFSDRKTYFYTPGIRPEQELLMKAYGMEIVYCREESFAKSYETALQEIKKRSGRGRF